MIKDCELVFIGKKCKQHKPFKEVEEYKIGDNATQYEKEIFELWNSIIDGKYIYDVSNIQHYQFGHRAKGFCKRWEDFLKFREDLLRVYGRALKSLFKDDGFDVIIDLRGEEELLNINNMVFIPKKVGEYAIKRYRLFKSKESVISLCKEYNSNENNIVIKFISFYSGINFVKEKYVEKLNVYKEKAKKLDEDNLMECRSYLMKKGFSMKVFSFVKNLNKGLNLGVN